MNRFFKKIAVVLAMAMVFAAIPLSTFAATPVTDEATLAAAVAAGGEIDLQNSIVLTNALIVDGNVTINLNGYDITTTGAMVLAVKDTGNVVINGTGTLESASAGYTVFVKGTLQMNNINVVAEGGTGAWAVASAADATVTVSGGSITSTGYAAAAMDTSAMNLNGVTVTSTGTGNISALVTNATSEFTVTGGTVTSAGYAAFVGNSSTLTLDGATVVSESTDYAAISTNGTHSGSTISVKNSSITSAVMGIYQPSDSTLTVENSTLTAPTAVEINKGVVTMTNTVVSGGVSVTDETNTTVNLDNVTATTSPSVLPDGYESVSIDGIITIGKHEPTTLVEAKAPTCMNAGNSAHEKCDFCNRTYVGGVEVDPATLVVAATGEHVWGYNTQFDAAAHWDYCHVCGAQNTPVAHSDANGDGYCVCGWPMTSAPSRVNPNTGVTAEMLK